MSNVNIQYGVQVFDGVTSNLLTLSRAGTYSFGNYTILFNERVSIPANTTAMQIAIPTNGQAIIIENLGGVALTIQLNGNSGTQLSIAPTTPTTPGIFEWTPGPSGLTSLYLTNLSSTVSLSVNIVVAG